MPTHIEIQKTVRAISLNHHAQHHHAQHSHPPFMQLVDVGDKPRELIGSSQWIGAVEISYCLDRLYGVCDKDVHK